MLEISNSVGKTVLRNTYCNVETTNGDVEGWSVAVPGKYTFYLRKDLQLAYAKVFKPFSTLSRKVVMDEMKKY